MIIEATKTPERVPRTSAARITEYYSYIYSRMPYFVVKPSALRQPYSQTFSCTFDVVDTSSK